MYVHGDLSLEFLRQLIKNRLFVQRLPTVPLVVEPVDYVLLQVVTYL